MGIRESRDTATYSPTVKQKIFFHHDLQRKTQSYSGKRYQGRPNAFKRQICSSVSVAAGRDKVQRYLLARQRTVKNQFRPTVPALNLTMSYHPHFHFRPAAAEPINHWDLGCLDNDCVNG